MRCWLEYRPQKEELVRVPTRKGGSCERFDLKRRRSPLKVQSKEVELLSVQPGEEELVSGPNKRRGTQERFVRVRNRRRKTRTRST